MGFRGGYTFRGFEGTAQASLYEAEIPSSVRIPLVFAGTPLTVTKTAGETVSAGESLLSSEKSESITLPSPINGTIAEITDEYIELSGNGTTSFSRHPDHTRAPWHLDKNEAFSRFAASGGLVLFNGAVASPEDAAVVRTIVVNAVHNGPLDNAWKPGVTGGTHEFANGIRTLETLFPDASKVIGVNTKNAGFYRAADIAERANVAVLSDKYPQEHDRLIVRDTIGTTLVAPDGSRDHSILVLSHFDVFQAGEILTTGRPLIDRIVMVAGPGVSRPGWYRVRIGTPFADIKRTLFKSEERIPWRIIRGNVFEGNVLEDVDEAFTEPADNTVSVIREEATRTLFRFMLPMFAQDSYPVVTAAKALPFLPKRLDSNVHGGVRPCVQCNYCDEVCPVGIYPHIIWKHVTVDSVEQCFRFRPFDCVGCGLCDYVCPSKIAISGAVAEASTVYRNTRKTDEAAD